MLYMDKIIWAFGYEVAK